MDVFMTLIVLRIPGICKGARVVWYRRGNPKKAGIYFLKIVYLFLMFKLQSPSKYSPFDTRHLSRHFFHCSKQFLNLLILMAFSASAIFCFTSSTLAKHFPLRMFFFWGNKPKKKVAQGKIRWMEGWGGEVMPFFGQKLLNTSMVCEGVLVNHPSWNRQTHWKSSKKFTEANHSLS